MKPDSIEAHWLSDERIGKKIVGLANSKARGKSKDLKITGDNSFETMYRKIENDKGSAGMNIFTDDMTRKKERKRKQGEGDEGGERGKWRKGRRRRGYIGAEDDERGNSESEKTGIMGWRRTRG